VEVADGILNCGSITLSNTANANRDCILSLNNGSITCSGSITMGGVNTENNVNITGSGTINVGGSITGGDLTDSGTGTVNFSGSGVTIGGAAASALYQFYNLTISEPAPRRWATPG
jgi:hypothetical protein